MKGGRSIFLTFLLISANLAVFSQGNPYLHAKKTNEKIVIDGYAREEIWQSSMAAKDFHQYFPNDTSLAAAKTEVYVTYEEGDFKFIQDDCGIKVIDESGAWP